MADNKKKLTHKVTLMQGGVEATFRLTDEEYNALENVKKTMVENVLTSLSLRGQIIIYQSQNAIDFILFSTITTEISISLRNKGIYVLN